MEPSVEAIVFENEPNTIYAYRDSGLFIASISGGSGDDRLVGDGADNFLFGHGGDDALIGGDGNDVLYVGSGNDEADGGAGLADVVRLPGAKDDYVASKQSDGKIILTSSEHGTKTLENIEFIVFDSTPNLHYIYDETDGLQIKNYLNVNQPVTYVGSDLDNIMIGSRHDDTLSGLGGDDQIISGGGNDEIDGGEGRDSVVLTGRQFDWTVVEQSDGTLELWNKVTRETVSIKNVEYFQFVDDPDPHKIYYYDPDVNQGSYVSIAQNYGTDGDDTIYGDDGSNILYGRSGDDTLIGARRDDVLITGSGDDKADGGSGEDVVVVPGFMADYTVAHNADGDLQLVSAKHGTKTLIAIEFIVFEQDRSKVYKHEINSGLVLSNINGSEEDDLLVGDSHHNTIYGGAGNDVIKGGDGDDVIYAGTGDDQVDGGGGDDIVYVEGKFSDYNVVRFAETENGDSYLSLSSVKFGIKRLTHVEHVQFEDKLIRVDQLPVIPGEIETVTEMRQIVFTGNLRHLSYSYESGESLGDDNPNFITGTEHVDILWGRGGDDILAGGDGFDLIHGEDGVDTVSYEDEASSYDREFMVDLAHFEGTTIGKAWYRDKDESGLFPDESERSSADLLFDIENVVGGNFDDVLLGNEFSNILAGGMGDDTLRGRGGDDLLNTGIGNDIADGGSGFDTAILPGKLEDYTVSKGGNYLFLVSATHGAKTLTGIEAVKFEGEVGQVYYYDTELSSMVPAEFVSHQAAPKVDVNKGDLIYGTHSDDLVITTDGADTIFGGDGSDTVSYEQESLVLDRRFYVDLESGIAGYADKDSPIINVSRDVADRLFSIENVVGGKYDDELYGDANANILNGNGGDDTLHGRGGDDILHTGTGDDVVDGGAGIDIAYLPGKFSDYTLTMIEKADGTYTVRLASTKHGAKSFNNVEYFQFEGDLNTDQNTWPVYSLNNGVLTAVQISSTDQDDIIEGTVGNDFLAGGDGVNEIDGGTGVDTVTYESEGTAEDRRFKVDLREGIAFFADKDATKFRDEDVADRLVDIENAVGGMHDDIIYGDDQGNALFGGAGDDVLFGRGGNDYIDTGSGNDIVYGGVGFDLVRIPGNIADHVISISIDGSKRVVDRSGDNKEVKSLYGVEAIEFDDSIAIFDSLSGFSELIAKDGATINPDELTFEFDKIIGAELADQIRGNDKGNMIDGDGGDDIIHGLKGSDWLFGDEGNDKIFGGEGDDHIDGGDGDDEIHGGEGDDLIFAGYGRDKIFGGEGFDTVVLEGSVQDYIIVGNNYYSKPQEGDTGIGPYGVKVIGSDVERVQFRDSSLDLDVFTPDPNNRVSGTLDLSALQSSYHDASGDSEAYLVISGVSEGVLITAEGVVRGGIDADGKYTYTIPLDEIDNIQFDYLEGTDVTTIRTSIVEAPKSGWTTQDRNNLVGKALTVNYGSRKDLYSFYLPDTLVFVYDRTKGDLVDSSESGGEDLEWHQVIFRDSENVETILSVHNHEINDQWVQEGNKFGSFGIGYSQRMAAVYVARYDATDEFALGAQLVQYHEIKTTITAFEDRVVINGRVTLDWKARALVLATDTSKQLNLYAGYTVEIGADATFETFLGYGNYEVRIAAWARTLAEGEVAFGDNKYGLHGTLHGAATAGAFLLFTKSIEVIPSFNLEASGFAAKGVGVGFWIEGELMWDNGKLTIGYYLGGKAFFGFGLGIKLTIDFNEPTDNAIKGAPEYQFDFFYNRYTGENYVAEVTIHETGITSIANFSDYGNYRVKVEFLENRLVLYSTDSDEEISLSQDDFPSFHQQNMNHIRDGLASVVYGSPNDDVIVGDSKDNTFYGQGGNDRINGKGGNDYISGGSGNDILKGGAGIDTVSYAYRTEGINISLRDNSAWETLVQGGERDQLSGFENVVGGQGDDYIWGDGKGNSLMGGKGNDRIYGHGGEDFLSGGEGSDYLYGGRGADHIYGGHGEDYMYGGDDGDMFIISLAGQDFDYIMDFDISEGDRVQIWNWSNSETAKDMYNDIKQGNHEHDNGAQAYRDKYSIVQDGDESYLKIDLGDGNYLALHGVDEFSLDYFTFL